MLDLAFQKIAYFTGNKKLKSGQKQLLDFNVDNDLSKTWPLQLFIFILASFFWIPFIISSSQYQSTDWYLFLFLSRILLFSSSLILAVIVLIKQKPLKNGISIYYLFCSIIQISHGHFEGPNSIDFFKYSSLFFFVSSFSFEGHLKTWIYYFFSPFIFCQLLVISFKNQSLYSSIPHFVDSFSYSLSLTMFSFIAIFIAFRRHQTYLINLKLQKHLTEERENRIKIIERELSGIKDKIKETSRLSAMGDIAQQVFHDIKSPLTALELSIDDLKKVPEETRLIIQSAVNRIKDIANNLIQEHHNEEKNETMPLVSLVESIISEKRLQYKNFENLKINFQITEENFFIFSLVNPNDFKRVFSNILNNSIESSKKNLSINIIIKKINNFAQISIVDNGIGIKKEYLTLIFKKGFSQGKKNGQGLGLYHAKKVITQWGGKIMIQSEDKKGTEVSISLPVTPPPPWFPLYLNVEENIVIADDDESIHFIWKKRLKEIKSTILNIISVKSLSELKIQIERLSGKKFLLLCDFEFFDNLSNGLKFIIDEGLAQNSILVTSRFEQSEIRKNCVLNRIKLLPKSMALTIPLRENKENAKTAKDEFILVDDDYSIRSTWQLSARKYNIQLRTFDSPTSFSNCINTISKDAKIYLDCDFGKNNERGEFFSKKIFDQGFKNIYLTTGANLKNKQQFTHIKEVITKIPPWF